MNDFEKKRFECTFDEDSIKEFMSKGENFFIHKDGEFLEIAEQDLINL